MQGRQGAIPSFAAPLVLSGMLFMSSLSILSPYVTLDGAVQVTPSTRDSDAELAWSAIRDSATHQHRRITGIVSLSKQLNQKHRASQSRWKQFIRCLLGVSNVRVGAGQKTRKRPGKT